MKAYIKSSFTESIVTLVNMIKRGKINNKKVKVALDEIDLEFPGELVSTPIKKEDKPWDENSLKKVNDHIVVCLHDKNSIIHMSEISDELYRVRKIKKSLGIAGGLALLVTLSIILIQLRK